MNKIKNLNMYQKIILLLLTAMFGLQLEQAYIVVAVEITVRMVLFYFRYRGGKWKTVMQRMEKKSVVKS